MVTWKSAENQQRLVATIFAAHPGLKLDYFAMAAMFGEGATYDSIEGQCRKYKRQAEELKVEAVQRGISLSDISHVRGSGSASGTPKTPRTSSRGGVAKPSSSTKGKKGSAPGSKATGSPTKRGSKKLAGRNLIEAIYVEDDDDEGDEDEDEDGYVADSYGVLVKSEDGDDCVLPSIEPPVYGLPGPRIKTESHGEDQDRLTHDDSSRSKSRSTTVRGKSKAPKKDADGDEEMGEFTPAGFRNKRESAPDRSLRVSLENGEYETDTSEGVA
ncbi:hypothetical protein BJY01DRAFT_244502 [Aspergillus pseudoustus]|uniref:Uncharacterized protein n=1 Tax=Aspergillus pseudoustus TaxID=1810923 RepID=A0ABR4KJP4_9EURO